MQLETFLTVYVALLGLLDGGSFASNDEWALGIILAVTTAFCLLFGLFIVAVAMCKLNSREPWIVAMKRTVRGSTAASDPSATPDANDAAAPDAVGFELMDKSKPKKVVDLEKGGGSAVQSPSEVATRVKAENAYLKREIDRLEADKQDLQRKLETAVKENKGLRHENEVLRVSSTLDQSGEDEAVTPDAIVEKALVEAPATAEDIELQATTEQRSKLAADVEASASQPEVDEDALKVMLAMGLQRQHCVVALRRCRGNTNAATEFCSRPKFYASTQDTKLHSNPACFWVESSTKLALSK